ncbi:glucose-6-phosphate isomerase [Helicobacter mesocricetorum]|uniref:glucose-6-phosphate isomerase n=1 Tax=Helicobacter mesocricetorum TaxID=87012 RepID=UPI000CF080F2|nr:glucose-6-phosphate isomerase [Helicobacter mesocricetorum]
MLKTSNTYENFLQNNPHLFQKDHLNHFFQQVLIEKNSNVTGYYHLPFADNTTIFEYLKNNESFLDSIKTLVIIGIGGSSLGTKAIDTLLSHQPHRKKIKLYFLEHTDPITIQKHLRHIHWQKTLFIAISKSGLTIETTSLLKFVLKKYALLKHKNHLLVITDINSPLHQWCCKENIQSITIQPNIGGRFSVLSAIGILPLGILGYDIKKLLKGAEKISQQFFVERKEEILKKALFLINNEKNFPINVLFSYSNVFKHFNLWYMQLWGESLGKLDIHQQRRGLTPIALIGSIDQHSFLQLIMQGTRNKTITFLNVENLTEESLYIPNISLEGLESTDFANKSSFNQLLNLQCVATKQSIMKENIPMDSITLERLCEESVGELIFYYELLTSCAGILLQVDTYNQPGVEFGKKVLREKFTHLK